MTTDREFETLVHSWLKEGGDALSERVAAGVMADLATTAQRRRTRADQPLALASRSDPVRPRLERRRDRRRRRRRRHPPRPTRTERGADRADAPEPSPSPSEPQIGSEPDPSKEAPSDNPSATSRGHWEAIDGLRITFDLPAGWSQPGGTGSSDVYPTPHVSGQKSDLAVNFYDDFETVLQDPCPSPYRQGGGTGTTPADLAARLRSATGYSATEPFDDTLAGYQGKRLTLQIPDSLDDCHYPPGLLLWIGRPTGFGSPSQRSTLWIRGRRRQACDDRGGLLPRDLRRGPCRPAS